MARARARALALALFVLALAGCAGTPTPLPAETATTPPGPVGMTATPGATATPAREATAGAETTPEEITPAPTSRAAGGADWPLFLRQIDLSIPAGNSYGPRALVVHPGLGRVYVRTHRQGVQGPGLVTVMEGDGGRVLEVVDTGPDDYAEGGLALDAARDRLYAVNPGDNTATVLDAQSLDVVSTLQGVDQLALDGARGRLYVAGLAGLRLLDVEGYGVRQEVAITGAPRFLDLAVAPGGERVYLVYRDAGGYGLSWHDAGTLQALGSRSLPGPVDDMVVDAGGGRLYLALNDGEQALFWTLDGSGELLEARALGDWTLHTALALDAEGQRLFLGRDAYKDYGVTILDLATGQEAGDLPLEQGPQALAWDAGSGRLLASHTYQNRVAALEPRPGGQREVYPTALNLVDLAVDPSRGKLYATDSAGRLHELDGATGEEEAVVPGEGRIAIDSAHGRLYTGGEGARLVRIYSLDPLQETGQIESQARPVAGVHDGGLYLAHGGIHLASLETLTITGAISDTLPDPAGFSPNPAAVDAVVDPESGRILAVVNNGVPGSNNGNYLYVYEADGAGGFRRILTDTERSVAYVEVDGGSERAYVSRRYMNLHATGLLEGGRRYTARVDALSGPLGLDAGAGRLYLSVTGQEEGYLVVLDAGNLDLLGALPIPGGYQLRALDGERGLLYLARQEGQVQIWSAMGGELPAPAEPDTAPLPAGEAVQLYPGPGDSPLLAGSLYRSTDAGASWQYIGGGLPRRGVAQVAISPDYGHDQTLFVALAATDEGLGIWRSADGGKSWRMASAGLSDLAVADLAISPAFAGDGTLFATTRKQGLFRSTDGGQSWTRLTEGYLQLEGYNEPPGLVALSPTYGQDRTVFVAHDGLHRSTDGGQSWTTVSQEKPDSLALSADFVEDGTLYGWFGAAGLLRSTDRGDSWQPVGQGLALAGHGYGRVLLGGGRVYFIWTPVASEDPPRYFRSDDGGETWQQLAGEPPRGLTPVRLSDDGGAFLTLGEQGRLVRRPVEEMDWRAATAPPVAEVVFYGLAFSPAFAADRTLYALSQGAGIYRSADAGLAWQPTGLALRPVSAQPAPLLVLPGDGGGQVLLLGSALGLYRWEDGGPWAAVGGGLPAGVAATTPWTGADGSLRLLSGAPEDEQRVFISADGGASWTSPLPPLPLPTIAQDLFLSPALASDGTAYLTASGRRPLRSLRGGAWQEVGPPGDSLLSAFQLAPTFEEDGLLLLRLDDQSLWRSTDRGDSWQKLAGPWGEEAAMGLTPGESYRLPAVTFSPDYAADGVLLTQAGTALYRSTDAGQAWSHVLELDSRFARAAFSPQYAQDGGVYVLQGATLYRSTDRGQRWERLPAPPWGASDDVQLEISPTFGQDGTLLAWSLSGAIWISRDGGRSWQDARAGLPAAPIREMLFSPGHAADGLLYLVPHAAGLFKWAGAGPWVPVTEAGQPPPPTATVTPPTATPAPLACPTEPERFRAAWQQAGERLGCPEEPAQQLTLAEQPFERGRMIWDSQRQQIYVLSQSGRWQAFADTWREGVDPAYDPALSPPPRQPQRGFGKVWREQLGGPEAEIGWATAVERAVNGWRQAFEGGELVWTDAVPQGATAPGTAYLLYEDGTWQAVASEIDR